MNKILKWIIGAIIGIIVTIIAYAIYVALKSIRRGWWEDYDKEEKDVSGRKMD